MVIGLTQYLVVAAVLFTLGVLGIFLNRKNIIVILMSVELILLRSTSTSSPSRPSGRSDGTGFRLFILTVAAAEAAIGLAILVVYYPQPRLDRGRRHQHDEGLSGQCTSQSSSSRFWAS
jgi:NADH-quinone oxidoreductase subunit K